MQLVSRVDTYTLQATLGHLNALPMHMIGDALLISSTVMTFFNSHISSSFFPLGDDPLLALEVLLPRSLGGLDASLPEKIVPAVHFVAAAGWPSANLTLLSLILMAVMLMKCFGGRDAMLNLLSERDALEQGQLLWRSLLASINEFSEQQANLELDSTRQEPSALAKKNHKTRSAP